MTQDEIKADVDSAVEEFAQLVEGQVVESTGIRPAPTIEVGETVFDTTPFDFGLDKAPDVAIQGEGGGITITYPPTGACCFPSGNCFIETESECGSDGGTYKGDHTNCTPGLCVSGACCIGTTCTVGSPTDCANNHGSYRGNGTTCSPTPCGCITGYYIVGGSGSDPAVYFLNANIHVHNKTAMSSNPTYDYIELTADWSTSIIGTCTSYGVPDNPALIFGCQAGQIAVVSASGSFINHYNAEVDLHCSLGTGSGGHVPCIVWGSPSPAGVNCCCGTGAVDSPNWYGDTWGACAGSNVVTITPSSYSQVCSSTSGGFDNTHEFTVTLA